MKKLLIVDGKTLSYKAFTSSKNSKIATTTGHNVPMLGNFMSYILELMGKYEPSSLVITFGCAEHPNRDIEADPTYRLQFALLQVLIEELDLECVFSGKYTADIIKTLVDKAEEQDFKSYVTTSEEKSLQLLTKKTHVIVLGKQKDIHYNPNKFYLEYGIEASHYPDMHALIGRGDDEVPGVPGIGEKTAIKIIHEYGSVETILRDMKSVSDFKLRELFDLYREELEQGIGSIKLQALESIDIDFEKMRFAGFGLSSQMVMKHFGLGRLLENPGDDGKPDLPLFEFME